MLCSVRKLLPAESVFCVGKIVDYKRWEAGRLSGKFLPAAGRHSPDKTLRFCSSAGKLRLSAEAAGFAGRGSAAACRHRRPARRKGTESSLSLRTVCPDSVPARPQLRITNYALRIFVDNRSLVGGGYHLGVSLKIAGNAVFLLNRHLFFTLFDFLVGNLKLDFIFGNVD